MRLHVSNHPDCQCAIEIDARFFVVIILYHLYSVPSICTIPTARARRFQHQFLLLLSRIAIGARERDAFHNVPLTTYPPNDTAHRHCLYVQSRFLFVSFLDPTLADFCTYFRWLSFLLRCVLLLILLPVLLHDVVLLLLCCSIGHNLT